MPRRISLSNTAPAAKDRIAEARVRSIFGRID